MKDYVYMLCTSDRFELPVLVCETVEEVARFTGLTMSGIRSAISVKVKVINKKYKLVKIYLSEEN